MLKKYFSVFFLFWACALFAQQQKIDSLKQVLQTNLHDTVRVKQLNDLAYLYSDSKPDTTLVLTQEAIALAKKIGFASGVATGINISGGAFYSTGNIPKALKLYIDALKKFEAIDDLQGIASSTNNIGGVYRAMGNYDQSLKYLFKALKIYKKTGTKNDVAGGLLNIGRVHFSQKKFDSARTYFLKAYDLALSENNSKTVKAISGSLGNIYAAMQKPEIAMEYYRAAFNKTEEDDEMIITALAMARIFSIKGNRDSTLYYAKYAYGIAQRADIPYGIFHSSDFLANYFARQKKYKWAYAFQRISLAAKDSLFGQEKRDKVQALAMEETLRQQKIEAALLKAKKEKKLQMQYIGITAAIVGLIFLFILLSRSIIIGEKWLGFLAIFILLLLFEFINLYLAPIISESTQYSPIWTLLTMVAIAALLVPLHNKIEKYVTQKMIRKNKRIKLAAAKKTIERLEKEE